jgi:hypothetical protein
MPGLGALLSGGASDDGDADGDWDARDKGPQKRNWKATLRQRPSRGNGYERGGGGGGRRLGADLRSELRAVVNGGGVERLRRGGAWSSAAERLENVAR